MAMLTLLPCPFLIRDEDFLTLKVVERPRLFEPCQPRSLTRSKSCHFLCIAQ